MKVFNVKSEYFIKFILKYVQNYYRGNNEQI